MTIDLDNYITNKKFVIDWFREKGHGDISSSVSTLAFYTFVPCIAISYWIGEETGWPPEAISSIKSLIDFYGYTKILNKPEGSPI